MGRTALLVSRAPTQPARTAKIQSRKQASGLSRAPVYCSRFYELSSIENPL